MWNLIQTGQFKKDLKRYQNQPTKISALMAVLKELKDPKTKDIFLARLGSHSELFGK